MGTYSALNSFALPFRVNQEICDSIIEHLNKNCSYAPDECKYINNYIFIPIEVATAIVISSCIGICSFQVMKKFSQNIAILHGFNSEIPTIFYGTILGNHLSYCPFFLLDGNEPNHIYSHFNYDQLFEI